MADRPIFPDTIRVATLLIEPGDTTTFQDLVTAGVDGSRIHAISITSNESVDNVVLLNYNDLTTEFPIGAIPVPTLSGTDGVVPVVSALNQTDLPWLGEDLSICLEGLDKLKAAAKTTVEAADQITLVVWYGDY